VKGKSMRKDGMKVRKSRSRDGEKWYVNFFFSLVPLCCCLFALVHFTGSGKVLATMRVGSRTRFIC
jgi:hypothetical protein